MIIVWEMNSYNVKKRWLLRKNSKFKMLRIVLEINLIEQINLAFKKA